MSRCQRVQYRSALSEWEVLSCSVPQGTKVRPYHFHLPHQRCFWKCHHSQLQVCWRSKPHEVRPANLPSNIGADVQDLDVWANKCKTMSIRFQRQPSNLIFTLLAKSLRWWMRPNFWALLYSLICVGSCRSTVWHQRVVADCTCLVVWALLSTCRGPGIRVHWVCAPDCWVCSVLCGMIVLMSIKLNNSKESKKGLPYHPWQHIHFLHWCLDSHRSVIARRDATIPMHSICQELYHIWEIFWVIPPEQHLSQHVPS